MDYEQSTAFIENLTEEDCVMVFHAMRRKFDWAGTFFTHDDVATCIEDRRDADGLEPLSEGGLEEAVKTVTDSRDWNKWLPDYMTEQGWEIINSCIWENIEQQEDN